ncbi:MAG: sensor hybrid histidine kinase [Holophagaceae bacterium]|nr:sensor hybrid histidine kinase [Holophagaceae bacterium]
MSSRIPLKACVTLAARVLLTALLVILAFGAATSLDARPSEQVEVRPGPLRTPVTAFNRALGEILLAKEGAREKQVAGLPADLARLAVVMPVVGACLLLAAFALVYARRRPSEQRIRDRAHADAQHQLGIQEDTNDQLQRINAILQASEEQLSVTLNSIGDAVIATDAAARVKILNPVAEQLTGWTLAEAMDRPLDDIFHIINQESRLPAVAPVMETLARGTIQGLANHTLLIARDGTERAIADSCAPIRDRDRKVVGAVLVFRNVTDEYASQQALRDSNAMIQTILGTVVDGIITIHARNGVIHTANPAAERMFGYAATELVGQGFGQLIPEFGQTQPDGALDLFQASEEARALGFGREIEGRRKSGQAFPLEMAAGEMWLGGQRYFTGILRDITARKQAEAALLKAGALQNAIFNSANFSSIATDAKGVIQIFNVGAERMLGYAAEDVLNKITPADISDPKELIERARALSEELGTTITPGFEALVFKASRGIEDIYELTYTRKDGSHLPALVSVTALRDALDAIIGYLLIGTDNTARIQIEAERTLLNATLQDKNAELMSARIIADKANLAKSEFLSSMSHELRSPLNAILGFAQLMDSATPAASPEQKASIDRILHAGWYLLELINEILDLAVIESGKLSISEEPVSLAEVMFDCRSIIEPQSQKRGITLTFPIFEAPTFVRADRVRLKQVLINLLSNAIKYNRPGGTVVVACTTTVQGQIRISVRDTGQGLSPDQVRQLFQPFNRLGQERSAEEGTGIGLVMSKLLVELMGGTIGVDSKAGTGSMFWYDLQASAPPEPPRLDERLPEKATAPGMDIEPLRTVLYVEDNPANLDLVSQIIGRRHDLRMLSAVDAMQGLQLARDHQPDVILMDINLPGLSGIGALALLQKDARTSPIPVIAISANAMVGDIRKGLEAGFFRYLTKPINVVEFMDTLDAALEPARQAYPKPGKELRFP